MKAHAAEVSNWPLANRIEEVLDTLISVVKESNSNNDESRINILKAAGSALVLILSLKEIERCVRLDTDLEVKLIAMLEG